MRIKLVVAAFMCILLASSCNFLKKHRLFSNKVDTILDMTIEEPQEFIVETPKPDTTEYIMGDVQEAPPMVVNDPVYSSSADKYFMIVGSFQNQNFARLYADKLQQMGYKTDVIEGSNGYFRVSAKSYKNYKLGISEIGNFRTSLSPNAWLHVKQ